MLANIQNYLQDKSKLWKIVMFVSIVLFMAALILLGLLWGGADHRTKSAVKANDKAALASASDQCPNCIRRRIDGVFVVPSVANLPLVAVMIDNHPDARPQSGIDQANLVYEAEVEGSYTRLMAIFASTDEIAKIGPVRSARPYFVDWADELGAIYGHCGGSPEALVDIEQMGLTDLNEFYNGKYFWRATNRSAPHNVYISADNFRKFISDNKATSTDYASWQYKEDSPSAVASATDEISINYRISDFQSKWVYDKTGNDYIRYFAGSPEFTADNNLIVAKNVVIQIVPATVIDNDLRLKMRDVGSGPATICLDGVCRTGQWNKQDASSRTIFSYTDGRQVQFNAGTTWVEVMRPN